MIRKLKMQHSSFECRCINLFVCWPFCQLFLSACPSVFSSISLFKVTCTRFMMKPTSHLFMLRFSKFFDFSNVWQHLWYSISIWNGTFFVPGGLFTRKSYEFGSVSLYGYNFFKSRFSVCFPDVWDDVPGNRIGKNLLFRFFVGNVGP